MDEQTTLDIQEEKKVDSVEEYKFEPIKGYPMLNWRGKRPFTSTQYYPAQLKENHGEPVDGWMNRIYWGDNLQVMSHLLKEFRGKVDLIYIDPPFDSRADYKMRLKIRGKSTSNDYQGFEEKQYSDIWNNDDYFQFIFERMILCRELLKNTGTFYLHCDWNRGHYLKVIGDEVFGSSNFRNHICWKRSTPRGNSSRRYPEIADFILFWSKTSEYDWNNQFKSYSKEYEDKYYNQIDEESGRRYQPTSLLGHEGVNPTYTWRGISKPWRYPKYRLEELEKSGLIYWPKSGGIPRFKRFLDEQKGIPIQSLWEDIPPVNSQAVEDTEYPTQKPEALLKRIIRGSTNKGDLVFDGFMGSGSTFAAALQLERRFIGADINVGAIQKTTKRVLNIESKSLLNAKSQGFSVFNVNNYDLFRNPIQAKEILIEALEIQPLPQNALYEGEKDGRMVKIMPVNRITTKADLNPLITGFDYKSLQRAQDKTPNQPALSLLLVCMGHEPDLAAYLKSQCHGFEIDVEVVDILRDKANLEFKRDSEAEIVIKDGNLIIDAFYPMNLLQKLSLQKEKVDKWQELVESVMIDWNYDGGVFEPTTVDVPEKDALVAGQYPVPKDAGTIRVKITDLLSESLEADVKHG